MSDATSSASSEHEGYKSAGRDGGRGAGQDRAAMSGPPAIIGRPPPPPPPPSARPSTGWRSSMRSRKTISRLQKPSAASTPRWSAPRARRGTVSQRPAAPRVASSARQGKPQPSFAIVLARNTRCSAGSGGRACWPPSRLRRSCSNGGEFTGAAGAGLLRIAVFAADCYRQSWRRGGDGSRCLEALERSNRPDDVFIIRAAIFSHCAALDGRGYLQQKTGPQWRGPP